MSWMIYCWNCEEVRAPDEDGFCTRCGTDNVFSYDTDEVDKMVADRQKGKADVR